MIVYRPAKTKSIILLSPSAVTEDVMSEIEKLGSVDYLIIPNAYHRTDAAVFKKRYPSAKVACPSGWARDAISDVVNVDMDARELSQLFQESLRVLHVGGQVEKESDGVFEYAYEFRCNDGSWAYVVTDGLFHFTESSFMNWIFGSRG
jgi:hypothetical protein